MSKMNFAGSGTPLTQDGFTGAAMELGVKAAELWSVFHVETRGFGFLPDRRPLILFERHKFHEATNGRHSSAANEDISDPEAGGYGHGGAHQYDRLDLAIALDRKAALESTSWGLGQVMGFHAVPLGYDDVEAMVRSMTGSEDAQLDAVVRFLRGNDLAKYLQTHDWAGFARRYNGKDYARNSYDTRLQSAYDRFVTGPLPDLRLRAAQACLLFLGFPPNGIDGLPGKFTRSATASFQKSVGLPVTGELDDTTWERLRHDAGF